MTRLTKSECADIRALWKAQDKILDARLREIVLDRRSDIEKEVCFTMREEGKESLPHPKRELNLYGLEFMERVQRRLLSAFRARLQLYKDNIQEAVCVRFDYCRKRRRGAFEREGWTIVFGVADALRSYLAKFPLPVTTVSVYLVKRRILDSWCGCEKESAEE